MGTLFNKFNRDFSRKLRENGLHTRPGADNGFWLGLLLPSTLILSVIKYPTTDLYNVTATISCGLALSSLHFLILSTSQSLISTKIKDVMVAFIIFIASYHFSERGFFLSLSIGFITTIVYRYVIIYALEKCPKCFTFGELMIVSQGIIIFIHCATFDLVQSFFNFPSTDLGIITAILEAGLLHVIAVILTIYTFSIRDGKWFTIVVGYYVGQMLFLLHVLMGGSPVLWILNYMSRSPERIFLVLYWAGCAAFAVITLSLQVHFSKKASTSTRKWFHAFAVMVYLPGIIYEPTLTYLASGIALASLLALETVRKIKLQPMSDMLDTGFDLLADEKDIGGLALTPMYLLVGMSAPLAIMPTLKKSILPYLSGVLSIGIGDAAASIIGKKIGRTKWPGSLRSVEGTVANFTSQLMILIGLRGFGYISTFGASSIISIIINSIVEAKTNQVDNLCLPFLTLTIMLLIPEKFLSF